MNSIKEKSLNTTKHVADKILMLRRANKMTQEIFAEKVGLDRRTIARAEDGVHRPSSETLEIIADIFNIPISYFYDNSSYRPDISKTALINRITTKLNVLSKKSLNKVLAFIDIID